MNNNDELNTDFLVLFKETASKRFVEETDKLMQSLKVLCNDIRHGKPRDEILRSLNDVGFYCQEFERRATVYFAFDQEKLEAAESIHPEMIRISSAIHDGLGDAEALIKLDVVNERMSRIAFGRS